MSKYLVNLEIADAVSFLYFLSNAVVKLILCFATLSIL